MIEAGSLVRPTKPILATHYGCGSQYSKIEPESEAKYIFEQLNLILTDTTAFRDDGFKIRSNSHDGSAFAQIEILSIS